MTNFCTINILSIHVIQPRLVLCRFVPSLVLLLLSRALAGVGIGEVSDFVLVTRTDALATKK